MSLESTSIPDLARSVLDGKAVDWRLVESIANPAEKMIIQQLH
jgi:hypothetical protein